MPSRNAWQKFRKTAFIAAVLLVLSLFSGTLGAQTQQSGPIGAEGVMPGEPPPNAPTISNPGNGQSFSKIPITVSGLCQSGLLVEVFKNNVFAGATTCQNGSYSIQIDLFSGQNDLVARQYDALNQASPDSNKVSVTFKDTQPSSGPRISLLTAYAKRGANPGDTLTWPLTLTGGTGPYAISITWGDNSEPTLISRAAPGDFTIEHIYEQSGTFNITIRATDANGATAFLQVVGVSNGPVDQSAATEQTGVVIRQKIPLFVWVILAMVIPFLLSAFWLGKRHREQTLRARARKAENSKK